MYARTMEPPGNVFSSILSLSKNRSNAVTQYAGTRQKITEDVASLCPDRLNEILRSRLAIPSPRLLPTATPIRVNITPTGA